MRLAVLNSWPNLEYSAEREFIARLKRACLNLGWECTEVVTSEEVIAAQPDCLIVTHEYSSKLTEIPTIGLLWSPPDFFQEDQTRVKSVLSYDGYLAGSESVRTYLEDLLFSTTKKSPISDWNFLPTAPSTEFRPPNLGEPTLFYAGVHWDGNRHGSLIAKLNATLPVAFYGDPAKWGRFGASYKGKIPFDGMSIFDRINEAGVALCLHRDEHLKHETPSMRLFESAAASAVIITENSNFARRNFGDSVLYVDQDSNAADKAAQICAHFEWIRSHPVEALALAEKSHAILNSHFALEKLLARLPDFLRQVKTAGGYDVGSPDKISPRVEVIVRVGGRDVTFIERCLDSLAAQSHPNLGLIVVSYQAVEGLDDLLKKYQTRFASIKQLTSKPTGCRSTPLWEGMRAVEGEYFCNLDDDDTLHQNHIGSLVALLESHNDYHVAYSGCIKIQDDPGHYYHQINFDGSIGAEIKENKHLVFLDPFQRKRILRFDNFVTSNSFLARRSLLQARDLIDPKLFVSEDVYLYFLFMRRGDFLFSWSATANWHWRSSGKDNSMMMDQAMWSQCIARIKLRTKYLNLAQDGYENLSCKDVLQPFATYAQRKFPRIKFLKRILKK